jgi:hypothetical protein
MAVGTGSSRVGKSSPGSLSKLLLNQFRLHMAEFGADREKGCRDSRHRPWQGKAELDGSRPLPRRRQHRVSSSHPRVVRCATSAGEKPSIEQVLKLQRVYGQPTWTMPRQFSL